eukprot:g12021.t1
MFHSLMNRNTGAGGGSGFAGSNGSGGGSGGSSGVGGSGTSQESLPRQCPHFVDESIVWPSQEEVAQRLFNQTQVVLGDRNISDFWGIEFLVLTPGFVTLRQQTVNRLAKSELVPAGDEESRVLMYTRSEANTTLFEAFRTRVRTEKQVLFVMIADECHTSATIDGAHTMYVNDEVLHNSDNFVLLGVSSEYYLGTVPFQADPKASMLHVNLINASGDINERFCIDIKNQPFSIPEHVAEAIDSELKRNVEYLDEKWRNKTSKKRIRMIPMIEFGYDRESCRFWFSIDETPQGFRLRLGNDGHNGILTKLGFSEDTTVEHPRLLAENLWVIGDAGEYGGRSLHEQRVRSDEGFGSLRTKFETTFRKSRNTTNPNDEELAAHSENLLLAEYLFSLAFLSMFRENGPTMKIVANATVSDASADEFEAKLKSVCNFDAGTAESDGPGSLKMVMEEVVKKARLVEYVTKAEKELQKAQPSMSAKPSERQCLRYILETKLAGSAVAETSSEEHAWFNETDRLLQSIVKGEKGRRTGHGQMVVMRVYSVKAQRSMQRCLRQAVQTLGFHDGSSEKHPLFSVMFDNGKDNTNISQHIEPYFRNSFNLLDAGIEGRAYTLTDRLKELDVVSLSYADLLNVPMILILVDKGRTGDTFPHSLGHFDLRIRTVGDTYSTFAQELGRLCRYQAFGRINEDGTGCSHEEAKKLGKEALGRKRVVKVSNPSGKLLGVADTSWQLEDILEKHGARLNVHVEESKNMYGKLFASKYTAGVAEKRANLAMQSCKPAGSRVDNFSWVENFQDLLCNVSGERITSEAGKALIKQFNIEAIAPFDEQGQSTRAQGSLESLKAAIDWDGRFHSHGVRLCVCEGQCSSECNKGAQDRSSFGVIPSIRVADLAKSGGKLDGVSGRWEMTSQEKRKAPYVSGDGEYVAKQPPRSWGNGFEPRCEQRRFQHPQSDKFQDLDVSIPESIQTLDELLEAKKEMRWIFTPSFNRFEPGQRQALLDRSSALQAHLSDPAVGKRVNVQVLVVRQGEFQSYSKFFGRHYVIMALPPSMPCGESPSSEECSPEEGGIGYARHFIQRWSKANGIPFVWMLDDNIQACHELNVETAEGNYEPCSFTHVMNSLERLMLASDSKTIVIPTTQNVQGSPQSIQHYVSGKQVPDNACPPKSDILRHGSNPRTPITGDRIVTVGDFSGRPGQYGVIGIARHRHGVSNNEGNAHKPFGVTHSVYSFCLLNVDSTVTRQAFYPIKRFWEDVEFNHVVDEKGLVVCMFRKFSHSKKNLQRLQTRRPPSGPAFQHKRIALADLRKWHQRGLDSDIELRHSDGLLHHLSEHVLRQIRVEAVICRDNNDIVTIDGRSFEIEPEVRMKVDPIIDVTEVPGSGTILMKLVGGIQNESFGVLKTLITEKVNPTVVERKEARFEERLLVLEFSLPSSDTEEQPAGPTADPKKKQTAHCTGEERRYSGDNNGNVADAARPLNDRVVIDLTGTPEKAREEEEPAD